MRNEIDAFIAPRPPHLLGEVALEQNIFCKLAIAFHKHGRIAVGKTIVDIAAHNDGQNDIGKQGPESRTVTAWLQEEIGGIVVGTFAGKQRYTHVAHG